MTFTLVAKLRTWPRRICAGKVSFVVRGGTAWSQCGGANDSLAFDVAWCSGTPAIDRGLLERKPDFYFLGRGLAGVRGLLDTAALRRRIARAVVGFAIAYNTVVIALCLAGQMNPLLAAILMPASSLVSLAVVCLGLA